MDRRGDDNRFPFLRALGATLGVFGLMALAGVVIGERAADWDDRMKNIYLFTGSLIWLLSLLSLVPVALSGGQGPARATVAYFIGAITRMALSILGAVVAVRVYQTPSSPVLAGIAAVYLPLLVVESVLVGSFVRRMKPVETGR